MPDQPSVKPHEVISFGNPLNSRQAVVSNVYDDDIEAVYFDRKWQAIAERFRWTDEHWEMVSDGPSGIYADDSGRLQSFVGDLCALYPESAKHRR